MDALQNDITGTSGYPGREIEPTSQTLQRILYASYQKHHVQAFSYRAEHTFTVQDHPRRWDLRVQIAYVDQEAVGN